MQANEQHLAAIALVTFCDLHGVNEPGIGQVRLCHSALESGDKSAAVKAFKQVPLGGNGCFNDWQPTEAAHFDYLLGTFRALVERWARLMCLLDDAPNNSFKPKPLRGSA
ncbi:hypothetical protein MNQ95_00175 [Pseudoxanthomonas daejeonensis]|uniref:hypothetical protein n=1 Tax=Pseudoxanthomonas daejeonensis TaxID=266062 RepID=UPI001F53F780|nr:hypothetical protein [Pseudoxanthomonas daejeonensis]UNK57580.1 hypothetical protein MNQ95_00175 [Pseudoxanthomonas daejeonensis]